MSQTDNTVSFVPVAKAGDVAEGSAIKVEVAGLQIAIFKFDGEFYATDDSCSHAYASLAEGYVTDGTVECPLHGACFSLKTGEVLSEPATEPIKTYPVRVDDGEILVGLSQ
jgi:3-phenylpropionate/trans-cinnamate dioxygenase ferredoxin component